MQNTLFSKDLQNKIDYLKSKREKIQLGSLNFESKLLLAPMSAICNAPFRLLMEELGAGGTVSELISCHGINYKNEKTKHMLKIDPREKNIGIQLFGEDSSAMSEAAKIAEDFGPKFIDINMGCPVRKVVTKGGGSALMKDPSKLGQFFGSIKKAIKVPLTIKIRTGWDEDSRNANEIINIAYNEGVEFVAVHGRTRTQQYKGLSDWEYLESLKENSPLALIGNGDLHTKPLVQKRMNDSKLNAFMLGRGPLRNPFLFLESFDTENEILFSPKDYLEIIKVLNDLTHEHAFNNRVPGIQLKKHVVWFAHGFDGVSKFRAQVFETKEIDETMKLAEDYFLSLEACGKNNKQIDHNKPFMMGGHG